jgi:hypothetical protein
MATVSGSARHDPQPERRDTIWGDRPVDFMALQVPHMRQPSSSQHGKAQAAIVRTTETPPAMHYTIVVVDVVGFGNPRRNNVNQLRVRDGLYHSLRLAFHTAGIPWDLCWIWDQGDGALILAPADVPKAAFADYLLEPLTDALLAHNKRHPVEEQIRLRLGLHAGEILHDSHGVTSGAIIHACRIVDAEIFKATFAESAGVLGVISSDWFYNEVVRQSDLSQVNSYVRVEVANKETTTPAWIRVAGPVSAVHPPLRWPRRRRGGRPRRRPVRGT